MLHHLRAEAELYAQLLRFLVQYPLQVGAVHVPEVGPVFGKHLVPIAFASAQEVPVVAVDGEDLGLGGKGLEEGVEAPSLEEAGAVWC